MKCTDPHLAQARRFYADALAVTHAYKLDPASVCGAFGNYDNRCPRLEPKTPCR